jgi:methylenetetrahydrofolate dehydrogenase (NADP+) / methenyltetrahydrofolate cyclohydrolase
MILLDGKKVAAEIKQQLKLEIAQLKEAGKQVPGLAAILVGDDPASAAYVAGKERDCIEVGMHSQVVRLPAETTEEELLKLVQKYNEDKAFHGILVQLPVPKHIDAMKIIEAISPAKDVDGFHPFNIGKLMIGVDGFVSCTPAGVHELMKYYNIETKGKHVVIVGRSNIVGKPMANIMIQKKAFANSIVTVCHSAAKDISVYTKQADILIAAIGVPQFIKADMVKDDVVVFDVGINRVEDAASKKGFKLVGDVDFNEVAPKSSYITPVPGGIGLMTRAMLLKNTYQSYKEWIKQ